MEKEKKFDQNKYIAEWKKKNVTQVHVQINKTKPEDVEIMEWIRSQPEGASGYLKRLAREDKERAGK